MSIEVEATAESSVGPEGRKIRLALRINGEELITLDDPGIGIDYASAVSRRFSHDQQRAIAKAVYEFADSVYAEIYRAGGEAACGREGTMKPEHPAVELRRAISVLETRAADLRQSLTIAEAQRDELRRLFVEPVMITGLDGPVVQS